MADHDQKVDKKMGQNDKNLIQDVAMEVKDKDKTQAQEDIEAKIEEGYIKLKGDINSRLTPLLQALTEAGVDGGLIASVEKEIHTNSRMLFFNRVMNSDINDMEEIRKLVQNESLQYLKPLFEDGEINREDVKISPEYTKAYLENNLLNLFEKQEENGLIDELQKEDAYKKAFGKNASPDDKKVSMALYVIATYSQKILFGELTYAEKALVEKALDDLRDFGDLYRESIEDVERALAGLPLKEVEPSNVVLVNNFRDEADMSAQEHIDKLVADIDLMKNKTPEEQSNLLAKLRSDKYGIDAIGKYFVERPDKDIGFRDFEKELISTCTKMLDDKTSEMDLDGFAGAQMLETLLFCYRHDSALYKSLLESFNGRVEKEVQISDDMVKVLSENPDIMTSLLTGDLESYYDEDGLKNMYGRLKSLIQEKGIKIGEPQFIEEVPQTSDSQVINEEELQFIVTPEYLEELDRQDAEREAQERDVSQITPEQKKNNMLKAMTGMTKARGLVKSQEWMDNLITNYPDKEIIAEAVVEFLEKQKESDEHFMDEDSKDARESVFESIVLSGIDNPEIFERMQKIDRETSKVVVKNVIEQVNSSRSVLNNVVSAIQALGKNLNEPEQEVEQDKIVEDTPLGFLKPEETELPKVDMFDNKRGNRGNEEPEDDWIR